MRSLFAKKEKQPKQHETQSLRPVNESKDQPVLIKQLSPPKELGPPFNNVPTPDYFGSSEDDDVDTKPNKQPYTPDPYTPRPGFNNRILLYGFMRDIEFNLSGASSMRIIPDTIMRLCDLYYSTPNIIFYFEAQTANSNALYIVDLDDIDRELTKKHIFTYGISQQNMLQSAGVSHESKIQLPQHIKGIDFNSDNYFDVLFKCGGWNATNSNAVDTNPSKYCFMYIWKCEDKYYESMKQIQLPDYPDNDGGGQSIVWSDKQQCLYSISQKNLNKLSLDEWKWSVNSLVFSFGHGRSRRGFMSSVIVTNDLCEERLISIGGASVESVNKGVTFCDLYDIEKDEWMKIADMNYPRHRAGIYHDKWSQRLFVGGGNGAERKIEYYDLSKNEWYFDKKNIPFTTMKHNVYPIIWNQDGHLLYIASIKANGVEFVDLRQENREWSVAYDTLDPLFDTEIVWYKAANCRLIQ